MPQFETGSRSTSFGPSAVKPHRHAKLRLVPRFGDAEAFQDFPFGCWDLRREGFSGAVARDGCRSQRSELLDRPPPNGEAWPAFPIPLPEARQAPNKEHHHSVTRTPDTVAVAFGGLFA